MREKLGGIVASIVFTVVIPTVLSLMIPSVAPQIGWPIIGVSVIIGITALLWGVTKHHLTDWKGKVTPVVIMVMGILLYGLGALLYFLEHRDAEPIPAAAFGSPYEQPRSHQTAPQHQSKIIVLGYQAREIKPDKPGAPVAAYEIVLEVKNIGSIPGDQPTWSGQISFSPADIDQDAAQRMLQIVDESWNKKLPPRGLAELEPQHVTQTHDSMSISAADYQAVLRGEKRMHLVCILRFADATTPTGGYRKSEFAGSVSAKHQDRIQILVNRTITVPGA